MRNFYPWSFSVLLISSKMRFSLATFCTACSSRARGDTCWQSSILVFVSAMQHQSRSCNKTARLLFSEKAGCFVLRKPISLHSINRGNPSRSGSSCRVCLETSASRLVDSRRRYKRVRLLPEYRCSGRGPAPIHHPASARHAPRPARPCLA